jgi:hypothetical protein
MAAGHQWQPAAAPAPSRFASLPRALISLLTHSLAPLSPLQHTRARARAQFRQRRRLGFRRRRRLVAAGEGLSLLPVSIDH